MEPTFLLKPLVKISFIYMNQNKICNISPRQTHKIISFWRSLFFCDSTYQHLDYQVCPRIKLAQRQSRSFASLRLIFCFYYLVLGSQDSVKRKCSYYGYRVRCHFNSGTPCSSRYKFFSLNTLYVCNIGSVRVMWVYIFTFSKVSLQFNSAKIIKYWTFSCLELTELPKLAS